MSISIRNRLAGTIEKIVSDKVISRSYHPNRGRNRDFDYYNGFSGANESERRRQRFCRNEGDLSFCGEGIVVRFDA